MYDEMAELEAAAEWANKLLNYACASNRNVLINEYPRYLPSLLRLAQRLQAEEKKQMKWRPISTFDSRMFSIMTNGTVDCTEVVKYKGNVPEWATHWCPMLEMPNGTEEARDDPVFFRHSTKLETQ